MTSRTTIPLLATALLILSAPVLAHGPSHGDRVEISPFAAYVFGGELDEHTNNVFDHDVEVDDHAAFGLRIGYRPNQTFAFELSYLRDETAVVEEGGLFEPDERIADMDIDILEGSFLFHFGGHRFEGFAGPGIGATRLTLEGGDFEDEVKLELSIGGGFKIYFTDNVGFRFDARHHWTLLDEDDDCRRCDNDNVELLDLTQISAGMLFTF